MARKHKHEAHANHERWLVSYADFITLLFATFTALYALSRSDVDKARAMAVSMREHFGSATNSVIPKTVLDYLGIPSDQPSPPQARRAAVQATKQAGQGDLEGLKGKLESYLMTQKLLGKVRVETQSRGLLISLIEGGFFESSQAEMKPESRVILAEIASRLRDFSNPIRVEGHTDTVPISSRNYPSNWELSSARASYVARLLATEYGIWPARLSAVGYAEFRPAFSNATPAGRSKNRRVDVVLLTGEDTPSRPSSSEPASTIWSPGEAPVSAPVHIP